MAEKRKRGQNFTMEEKDKLLKLLVQYKDIILNKKTDAPSNEAKAAVWVAVTDSFNTDGFVYRSKESLSKMWEKLKSESKIYNTTRLGTSKTSGRRPLVKIDPVLEHVCSILGYDSNFNTSVVGVNDFVDETEMDETCEIVNPASYIKVEIKDVALNPETDDFDDEVFKDTEMESEDFRTNTSSQSKRCATSHTNEREQSISCHCHKEVRRKVTIKSLKKKMLQEEIKFKRKLYHLQLTAADKELEIKSRILQQIKDGDLQLSLLSTRNKEDPLLPSFS